MRIHNGGKYETEKDLKATREHHPNAVAFKEPDHDKFAIIANVGSFVLLILLGFVVYLLGNPNASGANKQLEIGVICGALTIIPHELLHAICFKEDVYIYSNPSKMLFFVHGTEDMSKKRFIFMSLLPNIVFGLIPYIIFLINPNLMFWGVFGALCIGMGFGDYFNVFNAITQMPKGAKTYLSGFHSYWYKD